mmetsp:Transcript_56317/g.163338  ORF Transcript_56317/g.163338 Transcript_56317/m.163338 type:complete len:391 (-) Transcript_56317:291-1463(-)
MGTTCNTAAINNLLEEPVDPPIAGRWVSRRGQLHLIGVEMVVWHSGDISRFSKRRRVNGTVEYFTELHGQEITAKLNEDGDLVWCDGDLWKRDIRTVETGTYTAIQDVFSKAGESFRALSANTVALAAPLTLRLSTQTLPSACATGDEHMPAMLAEHASVQAAQAPRSGSASPRALGAAASPSPSSPRAVMTYRSRSASPRAGDARVDPEASSATHRSSGVLTRRNTPASPAVVGATAFSGLWASPTERSSSGSPRARSAAAQPVLWSEPSQRSSRTVPRRAYRASSNSPRVCSDRASPPGAPVDTGSLHSGSPHCDSSIDCGFDFGNDMEPQAFSGGEDAGGSSSAGGGCQVAVPRPKRRVGPAPTPRAERSPCTPASPSEARFPPGDR